MDDDGCSRATPHACALVRELQALDLTTRKRKRNKRRKKGGRAEDEEGGGSRKDNDEPPPALRILRASFSVLGPAAHLHPHCAPSNERLKFHLSLRAPRTPAGNGEGRSGRPCCTLRVGGEEPRAWEEGKVLFFDDSFEHEVLCDDACRRPRAVFQLVIEHPDLRKQQQQQQQQQQGNEGGVRGGLSLGAVH